MSSTTKINHVPNIFKRKNSKGGSYVSKELIVYSKTGCGQCVGVKMFLNQNNIPYKLINADSDEMRQEVFSQGGQSFPFIVAPNGETMSGFHPEKLKEIVKDMGL